jgi:hypothetical protein
MIWPAALVVPVKVSLPSIDGEIEPVSITPGTGLSWRSKAVTVTTAGTLLFIGSVSGLDCADVLVGASGLKVTATVLRAAPLVAVTVAVPDFVVLIDEVAMPFVAVTGDTMLPVRSLVNVTLVLSATRLLKQSCTVAVRMLLKPTVCETGWACSVKLHGAFGTKVTAVVPCAEPLVAVMRAVPTSVQLMRDPAAPFIVVASVGETVPRSLANVTSVSSATRFWYRSTIVAVNTLPIPATGDVGAA